MKRRAWFKTVAAIGVAALCPWVKREKAVDDRDQTLRISELRPRIRFAWGNAAGDVTSRNMTALTIVGDTSVTQLFCDAGYPPESDGKFRTASVAIKKQLAQTMDDKTLCRELAWGLIRSAARGHRLGLYEVGDPPPEWITKGTPVT